MYNFFHTLLFVLFFTSLSHSQIIRYVKQYATGYGDGSSWENASDDLRKMISASSDGDLIFVAKGTYRPNTASYMYPTNRENSFFIYTNLKMYGGFPENGGPWEERNWEDNPTVLSGDLMEDDWLGNYEDNSYHVVSFQGSHIHENCIVDGFTITGGNASHPERKDYQLGGGLFTGAAASPVFRNMLITGNRADIGGGWYNWTGNPTIENTVIRGNTARMGGGVGILEGKPKVNNVQIWDNHASENGGGIYIGNTSEFIWLLNVSLRGNTADLGGGVYKFDGYCGFVNSEIAGSVARQGSAIYNVSGFANLLNCTVAGNASATETILNSNGWVNIENSVVWGNEGLRTLHSLEKFAYSYSLITYLSTDIIQNHNLNGYWSPLFINLSQAEYTDDRAYWKPTVSGDFRLLTCSPLIDKGDRPRLHPDWNIDLGGSQRVVGENVDIGAYEYQGDARNVVYVDSAAAPGGDGKSWETALKSLNLAVQMANSCTMIETINVAKGTYYPEYKVGGRSDGRDRTFLFLNASVTVLGGYPTGGGNVRNWVENQTILSGDVDRNGILDDGNSFHVVILADEKYGRTVTLDGLIITGGNANEDQWNYLRPNYRWVENSRGGGVYHYYGFPVLRNMIIRGNAAIRGGGWCNREGWAKVYNSVFTGNSAQQLGGGVFVSDNSLEGYNMTVSGNYAGISGGGFYSKDYNQKFVNCIIRENQSDSGAPDHFGGSGEQFFRTIIGQYRYNTGEALNLGSAGILDPVTLRLLPGSPAIDAGIAYDGSSGFNFDLAGNMRLVGTALDLGAYEVQDGSLPVTLAAFNATLHENTVLLKWKTTEEVNASHFEVERSRDARNWETIGIVKAGNGTYTYSDLPTAFGTNGNPVLVYYRLRMVDYDRTFELSPIEAVTLKNMQDNRAVRIYPNPATDGKLTVEARGGVTLSDLRILDLTGREVKALQTTEQKVSLDVSDLSKGLYLIYIKSGEDLSVEKIAIQ